MTGQTVDILKKGRYYNINRIKGNDGNKTCVLSFREPAGGASRRKSACA